VSDQTIAMIGNDQNDVLDSFANPADHSLASAFDVQTINLVCEYKAGGEPLSVRHPDEPDAHDGCPDATALMAVVASGGGIGDILFVWEGAQ
jgi:hypothetical protein